MSQATPQDQMKDFMNQFNQFTTEPQQMFEPWNKLNQAFLKNAERMTEFSLSTMRSYSEMGLANMRQVAGIDSPESAQDFSSKQAEMLNEISQKMLADAQRMTELGNCMHEEVMQVMGEVHGQTNEQMQANMQKTADQATKAAQEYTENMNKMAEKATEQVSKVTEQATKATQQATKTAASAVKTNTTAANTAKTVTPTPSSASKSTAK